MRIGPELTAPANGIELCYQELGEPDGEPMVLVMGLGGQLVHWPDGLCELLAETGFRLIRFDNRDVGRSTWIKGPPPSRTAMLLGLPRGLAYTLDDMADDLGGLIETLGIGPAHVVGASQGGMIAQVLGYRRPELVRSLGLIMTGAGKRVASVPRLRALGTLMRELPRDREAYVEAMVKAFKVIGSPDTRTTRTGFAARWGAASTAATTRSVPPASSMRSPPPATAAEGCARCALRRSSSTAPVTRW